MFKEHFSGLCQLRVEFYYFSSTLVSQSLQHVLDSVVHLAKHYCAAVLFLRKCLTKRK